MSAAETEMPSAAKDRGAIRRGSWVRESNGRREGAEGGARRTQAMTKKCKGHYELEHEMKGEVQ